MLYGDRHGALRIVVLDRVVNEVDEQFPYVALVAVEQQTVALQPDVNFVPLNLRLQNLQGVLCRSFQCHRRVQHFRVFLDLRQADNVVDEK